MEIYLQDIAFNGGNPLPAERIKHYLPWSMSEAIKKRLNDKRPAIDDSS